MPVYRCASNALESTVDAAQARGETVVSTTQTEKGWVVVTNPPTPRERAWAPETRG